MGRKHPAKVTPPGASDLNDMDSEEAQKSKGEQKMLEPRRGVSSEKSGKPGELNWFVDRKPRDERAHPHQGYQRVG